MRVNSLQMSGHPSKKFLLQGVMAEQIGQHVSGFGNWLVTKHAQGYLEAFDGHHEDLVYLTAGTDPRLFSPLECALQCSVYQTCRRPCVPTWWPAQLSFALKEALNGMLH